MATGTQFPIQGQGPTGTEGDPLGVINLVGGSAAPTAVPGDALANPGAIPEELSFLVGWDAATLTWKRIQVVDGAPGTLLTTILTNGTLRDGLQGATSWQQIGNESLPGAGLMLYNGANWQMARTPTVFKPQNAVAIAVETTIWTPAAGKKFRLLGYHLGASVAGNVILRDNTAGTIIAVIPSAAGGAGTYVDLGNGILSAAASNVLTAQGPALDTLSGMVFGTEE